MSGSKVSLAFIRRVGVHPEKPYPGRPQGVYKGRNRAIDNAVEVWLREGSFPRLSAKKIAKSAHVSVKTARRAMDDVRRWAAKKAATGKR